MNKKPYTAVIRTCNSAPLVFGVVAALRMQSCPPASIIAVDSGSSHAELHRLKAVVDKLVDISDREFNYSRAINVGVSVSQTPYALIISSHLFLNEAGVMEKFLTELYRRDLEIGFMIARSDAVWECREVDVHSFDGTNGLTNSCSFLPVALVSAMPFREEVFSAEDQEWTARYLTATNGRMLGIATQSITYRNPRFSYAKKLNEELALAYYVDRRRLRVPRIGAWILKALWSLFRRDVSKAKFRMSVAWGLFMARRGTPSRSSKYF